LRLPSPFRGGAGGGVSDLTPRPPSLKGQGERFETPLSVPGRGWGRGASIQLFFKGLQKQEAARIRQNRFLACRISGLRLDDLSVICYQTDLMIIQKIKG